MKITVPKKICFVIGMGRSGTTLLSKLLNRHPQVHATAEAVFLIFFLEAYKSKDQFTSDEIELVFEQIKWFSYTHPWVGWTFDVEAVKEETLDFVNGKKVHYEELCKFIYTRFKVNGMDKSAALWLADKNPSYTLFTDKISQTFKEAKFIYIVRDYRANILSRKENPDLRSPEPRLNAWLWNFFNGRALAFARDHKDKVLLVKYEDFVENTEALSKKIFKFLKLDPTLAKDNTQYNRVNEGDYTIPQGHDARFRKKYEDLNKPVNKDRLDAWKSGLKPLEIVACESICGELGKEFGYKTSGKTHARINYFGFYMKAKMEILKERLIYYVAPKTKLRRLKKVYTQRGYDQQK